MRNERDYGRHGRLRDDANRPRHAVRSSRDDGFAPESRPARHAPRRERYSGSPSLRSFQLPFPPLFLLAAAVVALLVIFGVGSFACSLMQPHESQPVEETSTETEEPASSEAEDDQPVDTVSSHVRELLQLPEFPSGCEPASLTIVLRAMGYDVDIEDMFEVYVPLDATWTDSTSFLGDPYEGGGCFPPVIVNAANDFLSDHGSTATAMDITGSTFDEVLAIADAGMPVILWTTMYQEEPSFSGQEIGPYEWYTNEHCVVVYGSEGDEVLVSDPLDGLVKRDRAYFSALFETCGSMAVVIVDSESALDGLLTSEVGPEQLEYADLSVLDGLTPPEERPGEDRPRNYGGTSSEADDEGSSNSPSDPSPDPQPDSDADLQA